MREILFRGKSLGTGEWVEGDLLNNHDGRIFVGELGVGFYEVDPETVGQWTGLVDKNGVKIFEGDVVKYKCTWSFPSSTDLKTNIIESDRVMDVTEVVRYKNGEFTPRPRREDCEDYWYSYGYCDFEVIDNFWDNPELGGK